jgi:ABC-type iron transport system FetAB ATPase subunit
MVQNLLCVEDTRCDPNVFRQLLTWGRKSSLQVQDMASKVGGGEQQRSCLPETFLQLQCYEMVRYREQDGALS